MVRVRVRIRVRVRVRVRVRAAKVHLAARAGRHAPRRQGT
jgi:hypothetical protein